MTTETLNNTIEHLGIIKDITPNTIRVSLLNVSACSTCHTKATCAVSDVDNKVIDVINSGQKIKIGETVKVIFQKSLGPLALFLGYLMPFIILLIVLIGSWIILKDEIFAGVASLISVGIYYLTLTLFRDKLKSTFTFKILKD